MGILRALVVSTKEFIISTSTHCCTARWMHLLGGSPDLVWAAELANSPREGKHIVLLAGPGPGKLGQWQACVHGNANEFGTPQPDDREYWHTRTMFLEGRNFLTQHPAGDWEYRHTKTMFLEGRNFLTQYSAVGAVGHWKTWLESRSLCKPCYWRSMKDYRLQLNTRLTPHAWIVSPGLFIQINGIFIQIKGPGFYIWVQMTTFQRRAKEYLIKDSCCIL